MDNTATMWTVILGALPIFLLLLIKQYNEIRYVLPIKLRSRHDRAKLPPGSMGISFLGEMLLFLWYFKVIRRPDDFINSKRKQYGDGIGLYRTYLFGSPAIISCLPSANRFILQSADSFILQWPTVEIVGRKAVVTLQGKPHARLKGFIANAVNRPDALRRIAILVQPSIIQALNTWADKSRIVAFHEIRKLTFENTGRLFASLEPGPKLDYMDELFTGLLKGVRASPINIPGTAYRHALECRKKLLALFREQMEKKKNRAVDRETNYDLMDGLMSVEDEEGNKLSDEEVLDNIVSLVVAGYESTALTSMWAMYYLAKYPDVLHKLREENLALRDKKKGEFITSEDAASLKYTQKVVDETIRLTNVSPFVFRTATKDVEYKGYLFPKGWRVIPWIRYMHTNPENFDNPMCFNPDRWNEPVKLGTYQVFGGGARSCPGNMLAKLQIAIFIHYLSVGYKWELVNADAEVVYLSHPKPSDLVEVAFSRL
ncbi:unnamed protein product [Rhodiola kirilowii]